MEYESLKLVIDKIEGADFALIDSTTYPRPSLRKVTVGTSVLLFTNEGGSDYERLVKRRLLEAGKDPRDFVLSDLPWGQRVPNSPFIYNHGMYYLQTIVLEPGLFTCYLGNREVDLNDFVPSRRTNQGLPRKDEVIVSTYRLDHIDRIALMGQVLVADPRGLVPLGG